MLRLNWALLTPYILSPRVVADWWHPMPKEETYQKAKNLLYNADTSSGDNALLTINEINNLALIFTRLHKTEDLTQLLQYIREKMNLGLSNTHYISLFRILNYEREKDQIVELLELMREKGREFSSSQAITSADGASNNVGKPKAITLEVLSKVIDLIHTLSPKDGLERILKINALSQELNRIGATLESDEIDENKGRTTLVFKVTADSEAAVVTEWGNGDAALNSPSSFELAEEAAEKHSKTEYDHGVRYCPTLTSLMHHTANSMEGAVWLSALVALWIRSFNVLLSDWDYFFLFSSLLTHPEEVIFFSQALGTFHQFPPGEVTPRAVIERLEENDYLILNQLCNHNTIFHQSSVNKKIILVLNAMKVSLEKAGVDMDKPVDVGILNAQCTHVDGIINRLLHQALKSSSAAGRLGVGPFQVNPAILYHTLTLLLGTVRDSTAAVEMLPRAWQEGVEWAKSEKKLTNRGLSMMLTGKLPNETFNSLTLRSGEPFQINLFHLLDCGSLLQNASSFTLHKLKPFYSLISKEVIGSYITREDEIDEEKLNNELDQGNLTVSSLNISKESLTLSEGYAFSFISTEREAWRAFNHILSILDKNSRNGKKMLRPNGKNNNANNSHNEDSADNENNDDDHDDHQDIIASASEASEAVTSDMTNSTADSASRTERFHSKRQMNLNILNPPRRARALIKQFLLFCANNPPRNRKLTPNGLSERKKWNIYLNARDTALSLFGSSAQARTNMKIIYYNKNNTLPALRSDEILRWDLKEVADLFLANHKATCTTESTKSEESKESLKASELLDIYYLNPQRTTRSHIRCVPDSVPRHLWDENIYNPFPHVNLRNTFTEESDGSGERITEDFFLHVWRTIIVGDSSATNRMNREKQYSDNDNKNNNSNSNTVLNDAWYLRDAEMYILLMRCLIYRLDWEAAAQLTLKTMENTTYTYKMDHELNTIFKDIGDPAGCLAFKVATKLFDGRIVKDGQAKRDKFHSEQFS